MSGLRFKVGDLAFYAVARWPEGIPHIGEVVEVLEVGPFSPGDYCATLGRPVRNGGRHYACRAGRHVGLVFDWQLRPIARFAEPASLTRESCEELPA